MRNHFVPILGSFLLVAALAGCAQMRPPDEGPGDPDAAVADLRVAWLSAPATTLHAPSPCGPGHRSRAFIARQVENLVFRHPDHVPARMLAGVTAYESGDPVTATHHLDTLLRLEPRHAEAAILRARISLEAGNTVHAVTLLEDQAHLNPAHPGVREALASAYYLSHDPVRASAALDSALALGADRGRIAYNRGLIAEGQGDLAAATHHYQEALALVPGWPLPQARLAALNAPPAPGAVAGKAGAAAVSPPVRTSAPTERSR